jgi:hypothetical protein
MSIISRSIRLRGALHDVERIVASLAEISPSSWAPNTIGTAMDGLARVDVIVFCTSGTASA